MHTSSFGLDDDLDRPVWGVEAFARVLNRTPRQVYGDLEKKRLNANKFGKKWVSTPRRLLSSLDAATGTGNTKTPAPEPLDAA